jgi:hypothetical protein
VLPPGFGKILAEDGGVAAVGAVAGLLGGSEVTDWACPTAAAQANTPRLRTADLSKLDIRRLQILVWLNKGCLKILLARE